MTKHSYFVSFFRKKGDTEGVGFGVIEIKSQIENHEDIIELQKYLETVNNVDKIVIINIQKLPI